ncbi:hypothetical protein M527_04215 [Sphingobium indicum IP26]|nr:hypothetical protein M527_04215 [Sphingobium indicum IP26]
MTHLQERILTWPIGGEVKPAMAAIAIADQAVIIATGEMRMMVAAATTGNAAAA